MQEAFLNVNGNPTKVVTFGRWVEESPSKPVEDIILIISGNPGYTDFYKKFMKILHQRTNYPVWIVSHIGHEIPKIGSMETIPKLKGHEELFGLKSQIRHKADFIEGYVPASARLHLVGHSIGSYFILNLLKNEAINSRVHSVNLLFPTIERMGTSDNGKFLTKLIKPIIPLILFLTWIYSILPLFVSSFLTLIYTKIMGLPNYNVKIIQGFVNPTILENVFYLAFEELDHVIERDDDVIKQNLSKIRILYGSRDGWAPKTYYNKIVQDIPEIKAEISDYDHAFVLKQSEAIGEHVVAWLQAL